MHLALLMLGLSLSGHVFSKPSNPTGVLAPNGVASADSGVQKLVVELRIVVDHMVVERFSVHTKEGADIKQEITNDIRVVIHSVNNDYLSTLKKSGIDLQVGVKELIFWDSDAGFYKANEIGSDRLDDSIVLERFATYVEANSNSWNQYDYNILYTGYDFERNVTTSGYTNSVCNPVANSMMVQFGGNQESASSTAAFVAKGLAKQRPSCRNDEGYLDGNSVSNDTRFEFSPCFVEKFKTKFTELNSGKHGINCLSEQHTTIDEPTPIDDLMDSDIFTVASNCMRDTRGGSYSIGKCEIFSPYGSDQLCYELACDVGSHCMIVTPTEGMICGQGNKRCHKNKCVETSIKTVPQVMEEEAKYFEEQ